MSEQIPWTFTALGEDSFEEREAARLLHDRREARLFGQEIDARLIGFVWTVAPPLTDALVHVDLTDVGWLDRWVISQEGVEPESVPVLSLDPEALGVVARNGLLYLIDEHGFEREVELSDVWRRILAPGLRQLDTASDALLEELVALGGPALLDLTKP